MALGCLTAWPIARPMLCSFQELKLQEMRNKQIPLPEGFDPQKPLTLGDLAAGQGKGVLSLRELLMKVMGPYFVFRFFLLPLPLIFFGSTFYFSGVPWSHDPLQPTSLLANHIIRHHSSLAYSLATGSES